MIIGNTYKKLPINVLLNKLINGGNVKRDCFFELIKESQSRCASLLQGKSDEYNKCGENVFDSLKIMQKLGGKSSITAAIWDCGLCKQLAALKLILDKIDIGILPPTKVVHERLDDIHNYLYLLEAAIAEMKEINK
jgi:hypothetical protein